jgi:hypothetical protein
MSGKRLRYVLPCFNLPVAALLFNVAARQRAEHMALGNSIAVWDYIPPAQQVSYGLNFPAFAASVAMKWIAPRSTALELAVYLTCVGVMWYCVGLWADRRSTKAQVPPGTPASTVFRLLGMVGSVALGVFALSGVALYPILAISGLFWAAFLIWASARWPIEKRRAA